MGRRNSELVRRCQAYVVLELAKGVKFGKVQVCALEVT